MSISSSVTPRPSYSSLMTIPSHSEFTPSYASTRRPSNKKEEQFFYRRGSKLHTYGRDKAPYPLSYNREILDLFCIDHALILQSKQAVSFIDFKDSPPKRCLDLGTGLGDWVIDAAKRWPGCTFVGYDLVNVQIPLSYVDEDVANRIQWVYGNILKQRLPFEDDEFDFVHVHGMAFAIPESKWPAVFEEINRVLKPDGAVEVIEEDAIFPVLPRWFTAPLRARTETHSHDGSQRSPLTIAESLPHDHALLEHLFNDVFESRFLNPLPSAVLPGYFASVFRHVLSPPVLSFPMPPFAPLTPPPGELDSSSSIYMDDSEPSSLFLPDVNVEPRTPLSSDSSEDIPTGLEESSERDRCISTSTIDSNHFANGSAPAPKQRRSITPYMISEGSSSMGDEAAIQLLAMPEFAMYDEHSLFMHLYRATGLVLAIQEAMWEQLQEIIKTDQDSLRKYGWEPGDFADETSRKKFEALIEQYKRDMHVRMSLWHSLTRHGWPYPPRDPLSKAQLMDEERLRKAILEARKNATENELETPCRSLRLLVGMKEA